MQSGSLVSLLAALVLASCAPSSPTRPAATGAALATPAPGATPTPLAVHVVGEATGGQMASIKIRRGDRLVYEIRSTKHEAANATGNATFDNAQILFYDPKGGVLDTRAPLALANETAKTVIMKGGVRARSHSGSVLTCDTLIYRADTERLHAVGHVVLTSASGSRATSNEATSDVRLDNVEFLGGPA